MLRWASAACLGFLRRQDHGLYCWFAAYVALLTVELIRSSSWKIGCGLCSLPGAGAYRLVGVQTDVRRAHAVASWPVAASPQWEA